MCTTSFCTIMMNELQCHPSINQLLKFQLFALFPLFLYIIHVYIDRVYIQGAMFLGDSLVCLLFMFLNTTQPNPQQSTNINTIPAYYLAVIEWKTMFFMCLSRFWLSYLPPSISVAKSLVLSFALSLLPVPYSGASHLRLCTVGGALRHLELASSIYTLSM